MSGFWEALRSLFAPREPDLVVVAHGAPNPPNLPQSAPPPRIPVLTVGEGAGPQNVTHDGPWAGLAMQDSIMPAPPKPSPLSARDEARLTGVHPDLIRVVRRAARDGGQFAVLEGLRTKARQAQLVASGASQTMNSRHLTGHAVDLGATVAGEVRWDWPLYHALAVRVKAAALVEDVPIAWGGDWASFRDGPHWELSWARYPASASIPQPAPAKGATLSATDRDTLIRTVWGEAEGEGPVGQAAVVHVIRNRALARGTDAATECTRSRQFSCWNADEPRRAKVVALARDGAAYRAIGGVVDAAWTAPDTTGGARHYLTTALYRSPAAPGWSKPPAKVSAVIGGHTFLVGVA